MMCVLFICIYCFNTIRGGAPQALVEAGALPGFPRHGEGHERPRALAV